MILCSHITISKGKSDGSLPVSHFSPLKSRQLKVKVIAREKLASVRILLMAQKLAMGLASESKRTQSIACYLYWKYSHWSRRF